MTALLDAVAMAGERLVAAAGGRIAFDPQRALSRHDDLTLAEPGEWSPNRHCRMVKCRDGWMAVSLARAEDRDMVPAWTGAAFEDDPWEAINRPMSTFNANLDAYASRRTVQTPVVVLGPRETDAVQTP